jgi:RNA polymerase sigma factor (TIGR02999 family)
MDYTPPPSEVTQLLHALDQGDESAFERLIPLVYEDLRSIAHRRMKNEKEGHTLDTSAVVHEAYIRLAEQPGEWRDRKHFFAIASRVMRHILVDHARAREAEKRGGGGIPVPLEGSGARVEPKVVDLLELNDALSRLSRLDDRLALVVECRFFGGLSMEETAEALDVSVRTATRDWKRARAYLLEMLAP